MARLETTGFELGSLTAGMEFDTITNATARLSIQATTVRSGGFALQANNTVATDDDATVTKAYLASGGNSNDHHFRVYVRVATALSAARTIFSTRDVGAAINVFGIRLNTDNTLTLQDTGNVTTIGANSAALTTNTWYRIEVSYIFSATTPTVTAYIDGVSFASGTLANNANNNPSQYTVGLAGSNFTGNVFFDDIAINDSSAGGTQTGLPGDGSVKLLVPTGTGDAAGWTPFGAANWQNVDEIPPTDATDFNTINTLNATDMFNITNSGIGASDTVSVVHVGGRFNNQLASANSAFKFRVEKAAAGTKSDSAAIIPNSVTWRTNAKATPFVWPLTLYLDPDGAAWTQTTLDSAQIGYIMSTNGTQSVQVSGVWMLIDTTSVVATTTSTSSTSTSTTRSTSTSSTSTSHSTSSTSSSISTSSTSSSISTSSTSTSISTSSTSQSTSTSLTDTTTSTSMTTSTSTSISTSSTSSSISTSSTSTSLSTSTSISTSSTSTSISTSTTRSTSTSMSTSTSTSTTTPGIAALDMLGFETGDTDSLTITGSGLTATTSPVYSGTYALDVNTSASTGYHTGGAPSSTGVNGVFAKAALGAQFRLNIQSLPAANTKIFRISNFGGAESIALRLNTDGTLTLLDSVGTVVGTSAALSTATWYRITLKGTQNDTTGTAAAAINGVEFATGTGLNTTGSTWAQYTLGVFTSTTAHLVFDDLWIGDQAVYPADIRILNLKPNAVGSPDTWTGTFADIDETPISETDGRSDATLNDAFLNNLQDTGTVGISGTIWGIKAWDWWKSTDATGKTDLRLKDGAITSNTTGNNSTVSQYKANVQAVGVASGITWALSDIDALQVGAKTTVAPAGGQTVNVYAAGIEVAFDSTNGTSTSTSSTSSSTSTSQSTSTSSTSTSISTSSTSTSVSTSSTSTSISTSSTSTSISTSSTSTSHSTSSTSTSTSLSTSTSISTSSTSTSQSTSTSISTSSTSTSISTSSTSTSRSTSTSISTSSTSTSISTSSTSTSQSTSTSISTSSTSTSTSLSTSTTISTSSTSTSISTSSTSTSRSTSTSISTSSTSTSISTSSTSTSQSTSTSMSTSTTSQSTSTTQSFTTSTSSTSTSISTSSTSTSMSTSSTSTSISTSTSSTSTSRSTSTSISTSTTISTSSTSTSQSTSTSSTSTSMSTSTTQSTSTSRSTSTSSTSTSLSTSTSSTSTSRSTSTSMSTSTTISTSTSTSSTSISTSSTSTSISTSTTLPPDARTKTKIRVVIDRREIRTRIRNSQIRIQKSQISKVKVWSNED